MTYECSRLNASAAKLSNERSKYVVINGRIVYVIIMASFVCVIRTYQKQTLTAHLTVLLLKRLKPLMAQKRISREPFDSLSASFQASSSRYNVTSADVDEMLKRHSAHNSQIASLKYDRAQCSR